MFGIVIAVEWVEWIYSRRHVIASSPVPSSFRSSPVLAPFLSPFLSITAAVENQPLVKLTDFGLGLGVKLNQMVSGALDAAPTLKLNLQARIGRAHYFLKLLRTTQRQPCVSLAP
jgi:hypothetical protein